MSLPSLRDRARTPLLGLAVAALAVALAAPAGPAEAAKAPRITSEFFGVHHQGLHADGPIGWPQAPVGSVRLWDNGVSWREIEVAPGVFDWALLDAEIAKARANGASVLLVLGQTPAFHSTKPGRASTYGPGASAMPTKAAWTAYVRAVAYRNRTVWGGVADFQVWNEANVPGYWSGTPAQMAQLTSWTDRALRAAGSSATLVAPAMVTRLTSQRKWIDSYYKQRVRRKNVSAYVDAVSFQLYPAPSAGPEAAMTLLAAARRILARHGVNKPIWNTEVNYGLVGGPSAGATARGISVERQVANVLRTFALNAGNRVRRVYWYSWDLQGIANTPLVAADRITLTSAGRAFLTARSWLLRSRPTGCSKARNGTWTCTFTTSTQTRRVVWNPGKTVRYDVPRGRTQLTTWSSVTGTRPTSRRVRVGTVPVLFSTPR
jgi:polysaccharide biosynthesis protein PslG